MKRYSTYLVLGSWAVMLAAGQPGIHLMFWGAIMLLFLFSLRFVSHFEGQYMLRDAQARHGNGVAANFAVRRQLAFELGIATSIFVTMILVLYLLVKHVPWLWFSN